MSQQQWHPTSRHFDDKTTPTLPKWQPAAQPPTLLQQPVKSDNLNDCSSAAAAVNYSSATAAVTMTRSADNTTGSGSGSSCMSARSGSGRSVIGGGSWSVGTFSMGC